MRRRAESPEQWSERGQSLNGKELARLIEHWTDVLLVSELIQSPFLSTGESWDLRDWESQDIPNGIRFQRRDREGRVLEAVEAINAPENERTENESPGSVPTLLVMAGKIESGAETEKSATYVGVA
jgi:hypothetical protein